MANKTISELEESVALNGSDSFILDQVDPANSIASNTVYKTVSTQLSSMQQYILTDAPFLIVDGNANINGDVIIDSTLNVTVSADINKLDVESLYISDFLEVKGTAYIDGDTINEGDFDTYGELLSGGVPLFDIFAGYQDLQGVTDVGNTTTNTINVGGVSSTGDISTSSSFVSGGDDLSDILVHNSGDVVGMRRLTQAEYNLITPDDNIIYIILG